MELKSVFRRAALLLVASACSSNPGTKMCSTQSADITTFQSIQAGTLPALDGLLQIANSEGWPILGCTGYLFAWPDPDNKLDPISVESPTNAFPRVALTSESGVAWALVPIAFPEGATYQFTGYDGRLLSDSYSRVIEFDGGAEVSVVRPASTAHFERWPLVGDQSGTIAPREVKVWIPAQTPTRALYSHDGQEAFGPTVNLPSRVGESTLVVGIDANPANRAQEYEAAADFDTDGKPMGQHSTAYADYVQNVVRVLVEKHYGKPAKSGVVGCGAAGSAALKAPVRFPNTWDLVAGVSGDYGAGHFRAANATLYEQWTTLRSCPTGAIYLGGGGSAPDGGCADLDGDRYWDDPSGAADSYCQTAQLARTLQSLGCTGQLTVEQVSGGERCGGTYLSELPHIISTLEAP